ncbi:unnamed protein product [Arabis nemorensis]|uniref:DUF4283 domain-containing protein n=1 Tax=Arabis nemorensis TaxID=586526 RepID=A0A565AUT6_9BRAS|nr:unnamed protein product [Arabis nemorensis]
MFRPKKKKAHSLMEELKELDLIEDGAPVDIPDLENEDLIEKSNMSVVVRCLNPTVHKGLEDRVRGRGVDANRVQFIFDNETDLNHVLTRGPWFVNGWIVALDQWTPHPGPNFLNRIGFWIRLRGIPIHLLKEQTVDNIVRPLGKVENHAK